MVENRLEEELDPFNQKVEVIISQDEILRENLANLLQGEEINLADKPSPSPYMKIFVEIIKKESQADQLVQNLKERENLLVRNIAVIHSPDLNIADAKWWLRQAGFDLIHHHKNGLEALVKYIKNIIFNLQSIGSLGHYEVELKKSILSKKVKDIDYFVDKIRNFEIDLNQQILLQRFYEEIGDDKSQIQMLKGILRKDSNQLWAATKLALLSIKFGRIDYALELSEKLYKYTKIPNFNFYLLGVLHLYTGKAKRALYFFNDTDCKKESLEIERLKAGLLVRDQNSLNKVIKNPAHSGLYLNFLHERSLFAAKQNDMNFATQWMELAAILANKLNHPEAMKFVYNASVIMLRSEKVQHAQAFLNKQQSLNHTLKTNKKINNLLTQIENGLHQVEIEQISAFKLTSQFKNLALV